MAEAREIGPVVLALTGGCGAADRAQGGEAGAFGRCCGKIRGVTPLAGSRRAREIGAVVLAVTGACGAAAAVQGGGNELPVSYVVRCALTAIRAAAALLPALRAAGLEHFTLAAAAETGRSGAGPPLCYPEISTCAVAC